MVPNGGSPRKKTRPYVDVCGRCELAYDSSGTGTRTRMVCTGSACARLTLPECCFAAWLQSVSYRGTQREWQGNDWCASFSVRTIRDTLLANRHANYQSACCAPGSSLHAIEDRIADVAPCGDTNPNSQPLRPKKWCGNSHCESTHTPGHGNDIAINAGEPLHRMWPCEASVGVARHAPSFPQDYPNAGPAAITHE